MLFRSNIGYKKYNINCMEYKLKKVIFDNIREGKVV